MALLVRAALLLAVTVPLFSATHFHTPIWQIFVGAALGSALGQLAVRATRGRPPLVSIVIAACALLVAGGSATFFMRPAAPVAAVGRHLIVLANGKPPSLTLDDATALQGLAQVATIAPLERVRVTLATDQNIWTTSIVGTTPSYLDVRGWRVAKGAPFSADDMGAAAKVVVLGPSTAKQLFGDADPIGQSVRLKNVPMTVVGVLGETGSPDDDDTALVPLSTFQRKVGGSSYGHVFGGLFVILPRDGATSEPIRALLRDRHRLAPDAEDDFVLREP